MKPFQLDVPDSVLQKIYSRVRDAMWPDQAGIGGWEFGVSYPYMKDLVDYWLTEFDWRKAEANLNRFPQYQAEIDGFTVHFIHVKSNSKNSFPLILTHGWPGSVVEFLDIVEPLAFPERFGGNAEEGFDLVIPSLPGFGFSSKPKEELVGPVKTSRLWHTLMTEILGYHRFGAQGGDWGSIVATFLAFEHPESIAGIHLNLVPTAAQFEEEMTPEEEKWWVAAKEYRKRELDYFSLQTKTPQTIGFALSDSPLGTAAWIIDKFKKWSDSGKNLDATFTKDLLLTNVMIYLVTGTIDSSIGFYRGFYEETGGNVHPGPKIEVPTGVCLFPKERISGRPPKSLASQNYNVTRWTELPRGGHFPSLECPDLFLTDLRTFFGSLR